MHEAQCIPVFLDMQLIISEKSVAVSRLKAPFFTIFLEHPFLCRAFTEYAASLKKQYTLDKLTLKRKLEEVSSASFILSDLKE